MQQQFWNGLRAPGIPDSVNVSEFDNVGQIIQLAFQRYAQRPAFTSIGHTLNYQDVDQLSDQFCRYLQHHTDLQPGDRIAIQMANLLQYPVVLYGAIKAGLVIANTNPLYTEREMQHQFNDAGVKALVFMNNFGDKVARVLPQTQIKTVIGTDIGDLLPTGKRLMINFMMRYVKKMVPNFSIAGQLSLRQALKMGRQSPAAKPVTVNADDIAALQYTGGTTGVAKGAVLTHANLVANMMQMNANLQQLDTQGQALFNQAEEVLVAPLPFYHIYAFTVHLMSAVFNGNHNILIANPRDTDLFIRALQPWRPTIFVGLNTLFVALMQNPKFKQLDFSALKATNSGGTALADDTAKRWTAVTGSVIGEGYGLTECSPIVCVSGCGDFVNAKSVGLPLPNTALKVVDLQGQELPLGQAGELCVKGPQVMQGYWNRREDSLAVFDEQGWFKTGDIAIIDDKGVVSIVDRLKDIVIVSGFNVYPNEIEGVVLSHPDVEHAAVIGVNDDNTGEAVMLFVVPAHPRLSKETLLRHCRAQLTGYKVPKIVEFREELPMTPIGKVLRKELRKELEQARDKEYESLS